MDNMEIFKDLFAKNEAVRGEELTAGTRFRLMGLVADIAAFTRSLQTQVLDVVCHEAVVDVDADIDYAALAEQVMGYELTERAGADEQVNEQTRLVNEALGVLSDVLVHRSLNWKAPIRIFIFDDRVEIHSPGELPNGLTVEDIMKGTSMPRNEPS